LIVGSSFLAGFSLTRIEPVPLRTDAAHSMSRQASDLGYELSSTLCSSTSLLRRLTELT
jgi:hypothetical protein